VGTNIDVAELVAVSGLELVVGTKAELYGSPRSIPVASWRA
jgi:hypothetical protein